MHQYEWFSPSVRPSVRLPARPPARLQQLDSLIGSTCSPNKKSLIPIWLVRPFVYLWLWFWHDVTEEKGMCIYIPTIHVYICMYIYKHICVCISLKSQWHESKVWLDDEPREVKNFVSLWIGVIKTWGRREQTAQNTLWLPGQILDNLAAFVVCNMKGGLKHVVYFLNYNTSLQFHVLL